MTTITFALTFPGAVPMAGAKVEVEFDSGDGPAGYTSGGEVVGTRKFHVVSDGTYTLTDLAPCIDDMEGGIYRISVEGRHIRDIQPLDNGTYSWLDPAIKAPGGPGVQYIQGAPGGSGYVDTYAALTALFATEPTNTYGSATDVGGGTLYTNDGGTPVQMAPAVNDVGGTVLQSVAPTSNSDTTITTGGTFYRVTALSTASFTMPSRLVMARAVNLRAYRTTPDSGALSMQLRYTTDNWSTSSIVKAGTSPAIPGVTPFWLSEFMGIEGYVYASAAATVQVGLWVTHPTSSAVVRIPYDAAGVRPIVYAQVL
jgi:hypothetical protein